MPQVDATSFSALLFSRSYIILQIPPPTAPLHHYQIHHLPKKRATSTKKQSHFHVAVDGTITAEKTVKVKNSKTQKTQTLGMKHEKKIVLTVDSLLDPVVSLKKKTTDPQEIIAQNTAFSFVLSGCSKQVSNYTTIEFHQIHVQHLREYHNSQLGHLTIDNKSFQNPFEVNCQRTPLVMSTKTLLHHTKNLQIHQ